MQGNISSSKIHAKFLKRHLLQQENPLPPQPEHSPAQNQSYFSANSLPEAA